MATGQYLVHVIIDRWGSGLSVFQRSIIQDAGMGELWAFVGPILRLGTPTMRGQSGVKSSVT